MDNNTVFIEYTPSVVTLRAKDPAEQNNIDKLCSKTFYYRLPDAFYNGELHQGKRIDLYNKLNKSLPFGFAKQLVQLLKANGYTVRINNRIKEMEMERKKESWGFFRSTYSSLYSPRPYQDEAIISAIENRYGIIEVPCGGGKTLIAENIISFSKEYYSLFVTDGAELTDQIYQNFKERFPDHEVLKWGDNSKNKTIKGGKPVIIVSTYHSIGRMIEPELAKKIKCVVVDECHRIAAEMFSLVTKLIPEPYLRVGLSATPERDNEDTILVQGYLGEVLYRVDAETLINEGFLCRPHINTIKVATMSEDDMRLFLASRKVLFITERISSVEAFHEQFPFIDALTGQTPRKQFKERLKRFKEAEQDALVCTRVLDTGIDIPDINTVVLFNIFKSKVRVEQSLGRATRPHPGKSYCECFIDVSDEKARRTWRYLRDEFFMTKPHMKIEA